MEADDCEDESALVAAGDSTAPSGNTTEAAPGTAPTLDAAAGVGGPPANVVPGEALPAGKVIPAPGTEGGTTDAK